MRHLILGIGGTGSRVLEQLKTCLKNEWGREQSFLSIDFGTGFTSISYLQDTSQYCNKYVLLENFNKAKMANYEKLQSKVITSICSVINEFLLEQNNAIIKEYSKASQYSSNKIEFAITSVLNSQNVIKDYLPNTTVEYLEKLKVFTFGKLKSGKSTLINSLLRDKFACHKNDKLKNAINHYNRIMMDLGGGTVDITPSNDIYTFIAIKKASLFKPLHDNPMIQYIDKKNNESKKNIEFI